MSKATWSAQAHTDWLKSLKESELCDEITHACHLTQMAHDEWVRRGAKRWSILRLDHFISLFVSMAHDAREKEKADA